MIRVNRLILGVKTIAYGDCVRNNIIGIHPASPPQSPQKTEDPLLSSLIPVS